MSVQFIKNDDPKSKPDRKSAPATKQSKAAQAAKSKVLAASSNHGDAGQLRERLVAALPTNAFPKAIMDLLLSYCQRFLVFDLMGSRAYDLFGGYWCADNRVPWEVIEKREASDGVAYDYYEGGESYGSDSFMVDIPLYWHGRWASNIWTPATNSVYYSDAQCPPGLGRDEQHGGYIDRPSDMPCESDLIAAVAHLPEYRVFAVNLPDSDTIDLWALPGAKNWPFPESTTTTSTGAAAAVTTTKSSGSGGSGGSGGGGGEEAGDAPQPPVWSLLHSYPKLGSHRYCRVTDFRSADEISPPPISDIYHPVIAWCGRQRLIAYDTRMYDAPTIKRSGAFTILLIDFDTGALKARLSVPWRYTHWRVAVYQQLLYIPGTASDDDARNNRNIRNDESCDRLIVINRHSSLIAMWALNGPHQYKCLMDVKPPPDPTGLGNGGAINFRYDLEPRLDRITAIGRGTNHFICGWGSRIVSIDPPNKRPTDSKTANQTAWTDNPAPPPPQRPPEPRRANAKPAPPPFVPDAGTDHHTKWLVAKEERWCTTDIRNAWECDHWVGALPLSSSALTDARPKSSAAGGGSSGGDRGELIVVEFDRNAGGPNEYTPLYRLYTQVTASSPVWLSLYHSANGYQTPEWRLSIGRLHSDVHRNGIGHTLTAIGDRWISIRGLITPEAFNEREQKISAFVNRANELEREMNGLNTGFVPAFDPNQPPPPIAGSSAAAKKFNELLYPWHTARKLAFDLEYNRLNSARNDFSRSVWDLRTRKQIAVIDDLTNVGHWIFLNEAN